MDKMTYKLGVFFSKIMQAASNPQASEFFLCFVVKFFNIQLWVKTAPHS